MEQILIYHKNGTSELINSNSAVCAITQAEHRKALLGEDVITMSVESATVRNFGIGDYIQLFGMPAYTINQKPAVQKLANKKYQYELKFEGPQYNLGRVYFRNTDILSVNDASDFSLIGDIEMFLNVIINNLNRVFGAGKYALGAFPSGTETKNLLFNSENCLSVLQRICEEYKYQFTFTASGAQLILHVKNFGADLSYQFEYGQGKGLYKLTRENVDTKNMVNTLWAYGSNRNIPYNYKGGFPRLRLSVDYDLPVLENTSIANYGTFEGSITFDDIYPHRTGTVSAINTGNRLQFSDSSMDFDLNEKSGGEFLYLIAGNTAKVVFQAGNLAGYEFEIASYVHATKTFTLNQMKDPKGVDMPSDDAEAFQIQVGDTYVIVDIVMPQSYITAAELQLEDKALEYLEQNSYPLVKYSLELDEFYIKDTASSLNVFEVGDTVGIKDTDLDIDSRIKIIEFTRDILRPYKYSLTIQETTSSNIIRTFAVQNRYIRDFMKLKGLDDVVRAKTDWRSDLQLIAEIPRHLNETKNLGIGSKSQTIDFGNDTTVSRFKGSLQILQEGTSLNAELKAHGLTANRAIGIPDADIVLNDWETFVNVPDGIDAITRESGVLKIGKGDSSIRIGNNASVVEVPGVLNFGGENKLFRNNLPGYPDIDGLVLQTQSLFLPDATVVAKGFGIFDKFSIEQEEDDTKTNIVANNRIAQSGVGLDFLTTEEEDINFYVGDNKAAVFSNGETTIYSKLYLKNDNNFTEYIDFSGLTDNRIASLPNQNIIINDWNYLISKPQSKFEQSTPVTSWTVNHGYGKLVLCQVFDTSDKQIVASVTHLNENQVQIDFNQPKAGYVLVFGI